MNLKRKATPTKFYVILLIIAAALLMFIGSISFKQIIELRDSANSIAHTLEVEKEINNLFFIHSRMESSELKNLLRKDTLSYATIFNKYIKSADSSLINLKLLVNDNPVQQTHVRRISELQGELIDALNKISKSPKTRLKFSLNEKNKLDQVAYVMDKLNERKNLMIDKEEMLLKERRANYQSQALLTPYMILILGVFALFVFVISFIKINSERENRTQAEAFLASVMANTENIINYYEPVFNDSDEIKDFKLIYANERNRVDFNLDPEKIMGKLISDVLPFVKLNGEYEKLAESYKEKKVVRLNRQVKVEDDKIWLESTVRPLSNGILVVAKNTTFEKESVARLNDLNLKLQEQFSELQKKEAFLQSIFTSTSNVIAHYLPVKNKQGKIIDFTIAFTNEIIKDVTGDVAEDIKGKKISDVYPFLMENGVFETMAETATTGKTLKIEKEYDFLGSKKIFLTTSTKASDGITLTSRENTLERLAEKQMTSLNENLKIQNSILSDAEKMAQIGSFRFGSSAEESNLSENFYLLLGIDVDTFDVSHENYKKFIHPIDLENYEQELENAKEKNTDFNFLYRVITPSRKVKHFQTSGHSTDNMLVGVVQDVTAIIKNEQKLKEKNEELKRSNAELESFNRVASHDLQEPIRKIQMFISRIEDTDFDQLSDRSKSYFEKINTSSERMRMLIRYLLSYSRINKTSNDFINLDLSDILDKVQEDLEARIKESNVTLIIDDLPKIEAIPFQMEQLFNNLISNAIKYGNTEDPKIIIECKKLKKSQIKQNFVKKFKAYYRISIIDNGIGFEQEHSERIFELFQRLHQKNEYSGTGIGLAICKKIVQNHKGHIAAKSAPNKGTTINVYLPA